MLLTIAERPLWRWALRRKGGKLVLFAVGVTLADGLINAGGVYPFVPQLAQTGLGQMLIEVFGLSPSVSAPAAAVMRSRLGCSSLASQNISGKWSRAMDKAIQLGSCLYTVVGASIVAWGIWRAWCGRKISRPSTCRAAAAQLESAWRAGAALSRRGCAPQYVKCYRLDDTRKRAATRLANDPDDGLQPLAMPRKAANDDVALGGLGDVAATI